METPTYLTTEEVADILRIQRRTVQLKIRTGEIKALNFGTKAKPSYRIEPAEVDRYIADRLAA